MSLYLFVEWLTVGYATGYKLEDWSFSSGSRKGNQVNIGSEAYQIPVQWEVSKAGR
jgi:hypothetical protein